VEVHQKVIEPLGPGGDVRDLGLQLGARAPGSSGWEDVVDFDIERTVTGRFTRPNEWRQVMLEHRTRRLRIAVIFSL
jgi:hypothetical protein